MFSAVQISLNISTHEVICLNYQTELFYYIKTTMTLKVMNPKLAPTLHRPAAPVKEVDGTDVLEGELTGTLVSTEVILVLLMLEVGDVTV